MNEISHFFYSSATPSQHSLLRFLGIVNLCVNNSIQTNHSLMITLYFLKCKKKSETDYYSLAFKFINTYLPLKMYDYTREITTKFNICV